MSFPLLSALIFGRQLGRNRDSGATGMSTRLVAKSVRRRDQPAWLRTVVAALSRHKSEPRSGVLRWQPEHETRSTFHIRVSP